MEFENAIQEAEKQLRALLQKEALSFVEGNQAALVEFSREQLAAIFNQAAYDLQPIPVLPPTATASQRADFEEVLARRDRVAQLVSSAQLKNNQLVVKLRQDALAIVGKVTGAVAGLGFAILKGGLG